ncbi:MAG: cupin domain-containing protein [Pseudomonadota bacterium]|nr:MAG: cupin domain-containing protein [Pseudomonadota bacterium]
MVVDRAAVCSDWNARGFSCDLWVDSPGQVWADFVHDSDELVMLVEGEIELSFSGRTLQPVAGEEVLIPARNAHTVINTGRTTNRWLYGYRTR